MAQPGNLGNAAPGGANELARRVQELERQVQQLITGRSAQATVIEQGVFEVRGGEQQVTEDGALAVYDQQSGDAVSYSGRMDRTDGSGGRQMGTSWWRDDGTQALALADQGTVPGHPHQQALQWFDRLGHVVFADDTQSGQGVALPYLCIPMSDADLSPLPAITASTYQDASVGGAWKMSPRLMGMFLASASAGCTGRVRLMCNGVQVGGSVDIPANTVMFGYIGPAGSDGNFGDWQALNFQARVLSGAGEVRARMVTLQGQQS